MKLDLGCGNKKKEGFVGIDIIPLPEVDTVIDLEKFPWPFESDSIDEVYCSHYIEHTNDLVKFMDEVWRICRPGALCIFIAPYHSSSLAVQDPTHKQHISENTFYYFSAKWREGYTIGYYPIKANFEIVSIKGIYSADWVGKPENEIEYAKKHYLNVLDHLIVEMKAIK